MALENVNMTKRGPDAAPGSGIAQRLVVLMRTIEVTAAASALSTYSLGEVPASARLCGYLSKVQWDDLASAAAPTLDIGLFAVDGNITDDDNALQDGLDVAGSASSSVFPAAFVNDGKRLWEYVNGQSTDPGGNLEIKMTIQDGATNTGGTINLAIALLME